MSKLFDTLFADAKGNIEKAINEATDTPKEKILGRSLGTGKALHVDPLTIGKDNNKRETYSMQDKGIAYVSNVSDAPGSYSISNRYIDIDKTALANDINAIAQSFKGAVDRALLKAQHEGLEDKAAAIKALSLTPAKKGSTMYVRFSHTAVLVYLLNPAPYSELNDLFSNESIVSMLSTWQKNDPLVAAGIIDEVPYEDAPTAARFIAEGKFLAKVPDLVKLCDAIRVKYDSDSEIKHNVDTALNIFRSVKNEVISGPEYRATVLNTYYAAVAALSGSRGLALYAIDPRVSLPTPKDEYAGLDALLAGQRGKMRRVRNNGTRHDIAARYNVPVETIDALNGKGLYPGEVLKIPASKAGKTAGATAANYTVRENDSLGMIADRFNTSVASIASMNRMRGVIGLDKVSLVVPYFGKQTATGIDTTSDRSTETYQVVKAGESLADIASKFNTTVDTLRQLNPGADAFKDGVEPGDTLVVPGGMRSNLPSTRTHITAIGDTFKKWARVANTTVEKLKELNPDVKELEPGATLRINTSNLMNNHEVQPGESLASIAKQYNITTADLAKANPGLQEKFDTDFLILPPKTNRTPEAVELTDDILKSLQTDPALKLQTSGYSARQRAEYLYNKIAAKTRGINRAQDSVYDRQHGIKQGERIGHKTTSMINTKALNALTDRFGSFMAAVDLAVAGGNVSITETDYNTLLASLRDALTNPSVAPSKDSIAANVDIYMKTLHEMANEKFSDDPEGLDRVTKAFDVIQNLAKNSRVSSVSTPFAAGSTSRQAMPAELMRRALGPVVDAELLTPDDANAIVSGLIQSTKSIDSLVDDMGTASEQEAAKQLIATIYKPLLRIDYNGYKKIQEFGKWLKTENIFTNIRKGKYALRSRNAAGATSRREIYDEYQERTSKLAADLGVDRSVLGNTILSSADDTLAEWNRRYDFLPDNDEPGEKVTEYKGSAKKLVSAQGYNRYRLPLAIIELLRKRAKSSDYDARVLERLHSTVSEAKSSRESASSHDLTVKDLRNFFARTFTGGEDPISGINLADEDAAIITKWREDLAKTADIAGDIYSVIQLIASVLHKQRGYSSLKGRRTNAWTNISRAEDADAVSSILLGRCIEFVQGLRNGNDYDTLAAWPTLPDEDARKQELRGRMAEFVDSLTQSRNGEADTLIYRMMYNRIGEEGYDPVDAFVNRVNNLLTNDMMAVTPEVTVTPSPVSAADKTVPDNCMSVMNMMCSWKAKAGRDESGPISKVVFSTVKSKYSTGIAGGILSGDLFSETVKAEPIALTATQALFIDRMVTALDMFVRDMQSQDADTPAFIKSYTAGVIQDVKEGMSVLKAFRGGLADTISTAVKSQHVVHLSPDSFESELDISKLSVDQVINRVGSAVISGDFPSSASTYLRNSIINDDMFNIAQDTSDMLSSLFDYYAEASNLEVSVAAARRERLKAANGEEVVDTDVAGYEADIRAEVSELRKAFAGVLNLYDRASAKSPLPIHAVDIPSVKALLSGLQTHVSSITDEEALANYKKVVDEFKAEGNWSGASQLVDAEHPVVFMGIEQASTLSEKDEDYTAQAISSKGGRVLVQSKGVIRTRVLRDSKSADAKVSGVSFNPLGRNKGEAQSTGNLKTYSESITNVQEVLDRALEIVRALSNLEPAIAQPLEFDITSAKFNLSATNEILAKYLSMSANSLQTRGGQDEILSIFTTIKPPSNEFNPAKGFSRVLGENKGAHAGVGYLLQLFMLGTPDVTYKALVDAFSEDHLGGIENANDLMNVDRSDMKVAKARYAERAATEAKKAIDKMAAGVDTLAGIATNPTAGNSVAPNLVAVLAAMYDYNTLMSLNQITAAYLGKNSKATSEWNNFATKVRETRAKLEAALKQYEADPTTFKAVAALYRAANTSATTLIGGMPNSKLGELKSGLGSVLNEDVELLLQILEAVETPAENTGEADDADEDASVTPKSTVDIAKQMLAPASAAASILDAAGWEVQGDKLVDDEGGLLPDWSEIFLHDSINKHLFAAIMFYLDKNGVKSSQVANLFNGKVYYAFKTLKVKNGRGLLAPVFNFDVLYKSLENLNAFDRYSALPGAETGVEVGTQAADRRNADNLGFDEPDEAPEVPESTETPEEQPSATPADLTDQQARTLRHASPEAKDAVRDASSSVDLKKKSAAEISPEDIEAMLRSQGL